MSEIFDNPKKTDGKAAGQASDAPEVKGMEISDMKRQILEKLKEKKESAPAIVDNGKPAVSREEILRAIKRPFGALRPEGRIVIKKDEELLKRYENLKVEMDRKNAVVQDLERRLKEEKSRSAALTETLNTKDEKSAYVNKLHKELEEAKKITEAERAKHANLQVEHKKVALGRDETAKLLKILRTEADIKERSLRDLQKKVSRLNELEEMLRIKDNKTAEAAKISRELEEAKKLNDEYRAKIASMQEEKRGEETGRDEKIKDELARKDAFVLDLQKKFATEIDEVTKDRDRAAMNVESLRSKLYTATKEIKEQGTKISQLEEALRSKDKRVLEAERLQTAIDLTKNEAESKLRAAESDNKGLSEKYAKANDEFRSIMARLDQAEKSYKELEASHGEINSELQAGLRGKKELEAKLEQAGIELEAKTTRLAEADKLYKELDASVRELTAKLQENQHHTKEVEASNEDLALRLSNANRDKKEFEARIAELVSEAEAKTSRLASADRLHKELEAIIKDVESKFQASQQRVSDLEKETVLLAESLKTSDLKLKEVEDEAKNETERLRAELGPLKNTVMQKEKKELELKAALEQLEVEMQARDSKIEGDLRYTEKVIKEISELRKKVAALQRQSERTKSAGA
jgi:chromosome segregation ATPase